MRSESEYEQFSCKRLILKWRPCCSGLNILTHWGQNGCKFPDDIFKCIFLNENVSISIKSSLKCVPRCPINNILAFDRVMYRRRPGNKPLFEAMMVSLLTHICISDKKFHQPRLVIRTFYRQGRCSRGGHLCNEHCEEKYSCSYK